MTYIYGIMVVNTRSCCDIPPATMEALIESRETGTTPERCGNLVSFRSNVLSYEFKCRPPIRGDRVRIHLIGQTAALVLCHVSVFAFGKYKMKWDDLGNHWSVIPFNCETNLEIVNS